MGVYGCPGVIGEVQGECNCSFVLEISVDCLLCARHMALWTVCGVLGSQRAPPALEEPALTTSLYVQGYSL